jgi:hypothetical protein
MDGTTTLAQGQTDANGNIALEIDLRGKSGKGKPLFTPQPITVVASKGGFTSQSKKTTVIALATIDLNFALASP